MRIVLLVLCWLIRAGPGAAAPAEVLTNAAQIKALSVAEAASGRPVSIRGVATGEGSNGIVVQDATMGIFIWGHTNDLSWVKRGDLVSVQGVTDPGEFAPVIREAAVKKIGSAPTPEPRALSYDLLTSGAADAQWVETSGIVRSCQPVGPYQFKLILAVGGLRLTVQSFGPTNAFESLLDAEVRLRGICFYQFNHSRQILSPVLMVPGEQFLTLEQAAPAEPFSAPLREPQSLMVFSPENLRGHRVRVRGTVLHQQPGRALWLRAAGHGLRVETQQRLAVQPGDQIVALGFPGSGDYSPVLEDAIFKRLAPATNHPGPLVARPQLVKDKTDALEHDADLIQLDGKLTRITRTVNGWQFEVNWQGMSIEASLDEVPAPPAAWQTGSLVRLAGICRVTTETPSTAGGIREPREFQLLLRSPADLVVLKNPPWWTPARIFILLGAATGISLAAAALIAWLARVRLREQRLRRTMAETEFSAMFAERNRIAREIHDTLAQGLGAISMHLEMVKEQSGREPDTAARHLEIAHQMARQSLGEARNSIWNMRSQILENTDLASALRGILQQSTDDTAIARQFTVTGQPRRLAPAVENNLLRVGQEAITNAVRHAHPKTIAVTLDFSASEAGLTVRDDGSGFDPAHAAPGGHFGMIGQRERTAQMGGKLAVQSSPGCGTEVSVHIPIYD